MNPFCQIEYVSSGSDVGMPCSINIKAAAVQPPQVVNTRQGGCKPPTAVEDHPKDVTVPNAVPNAVQNCNFLGDQRALAT